MMNKYVFYLIASMACILLPIVGVLYGIWDSNQPRVGPIGDGHTTIKLFQIVPMISTFVIGVINLPIAIIRYRKHKDNRRS
jgi:hypothetical protein